MPRFVIAKAFYTASQQGECARDAQIMLSVCPNCLVLCAWTERPLTTALSTSPITPWSGVDVDEAARRIPADTASIFGAGQPA
jgi:hypothetical protein